MLRSTLFGCGRRHPWAPWGDGWRRRGGKNRREWLWREGKPHDSFVGPSGGDGTRSGWGDGTRGSDGVRGDRTRNGRRLWFILRLLASARFGAFWVLCDVRLVRVQWLVDTSRWFHVAVLNLCVVRFVDVAWQLGVTIYFLGVVGHLSVARVIFSFNVDLHLHHGYAPFGFGRWVVWEARSGAMRNFYGAGVVVLRLLPFELVQVALWLTVDVLERDALLGVVKDLPLVAALSFL